MLKVDEAQMVLRPQREKEQEKAESHMEMEDPAAESSTTITVIEEMAMETVQKEWPFEGSWCKSKKGDWWQFQHGQWWKQVVTVKWERYKDWSQTEEDGVQTGAWQDWSQEGWSQS